MARLELADVSEVEIARDQTTTAFMRKRGDVRVARARRGNIIDVHGVVTAFMEQRDHAR
jgi:hypothetical protein